MRKLRNVEINYLYFTTKHYWDEVVKETDVLKLLSSVQFVGQVLCVCVCVTARHTKPAI